MVDDKRIEEQEENIENTEKQEDKVKEKTQLTEDELLSTMAEDFADFITRNIKKFKGKSLQDIFLEFLKQADKEKKELWIFYSRN